MNNDYFETKEKHNNKVEIKYFVKDSAPEWVTELVRECHADNMPVDCIYEIVSDCIDSLIEFETHEKSYAACLNESNITYTYDILKQFNNLFYVIDSVWDELNDYLCEQQFDSPISYTQLVVSAYHSWVLGKCRDYLRANNFWKNEE